MLIDKEEIPVSVSMAVARWIKKKKKNILLTGSNSTSGFPFFFFFPLFSRLKTKKEF